MSVNHQNTWNLVDKTIKSTLFQQHLHFNWYKDLACSLIKSQMIKKIKNVVIRIPYHQTEDGRLLRLVEWFEPYYTWDKCINFKNHGEFFNNLTLSQSLCYIIFDISYCFNKSKKEKKNVHIKRDLLISNVKWMANFVVGKVCDTNSLCTNSFYSRFNSIEIILRENLRLLDLF